MPDSFFQNSPPRVRRDGEGCFPAPQWRINGFFPGALRTFSVYRLKMGGIMIQIYKISFPDGSAYVGQTRRPVSFRLAQHRGSNPCNSVLYRKLLIMKPTVEILSRHRKREVADREERKQIMRLEKPINRYVEGRQINKNPEAPPLRNNRWSRKRNRRERPKYSRKASGYNVCSWCWRKLPVSEFYSDRCRSVGLSSRCRECSKIQNKACRDAIKKKRILPPPTCG